MPYDSIKSIPNYVKKYSQVLQRQWIHVFNSTYDKVSKEGGDAEKRAMMAANSILKKRFTNGQNVSKESHSDYFSYLQDNFLKNLRG